MSIANIFILSSIPLCAMALSVCCKFRPRSDRVLERAAILQCIVTIISQSVVWREWGAWVMSLLSVVIKLLPWIRNMIKYPGIQDLREKNKAIWMKQLHVQAHELKEEDALQAREPNSTTDADRSHTAEQNPDFNSRRNPKWVWLPIISAALIVLGMPALTWFRFEWIIFIMIAVEQAFALVACAWAVFRVSKYYPLVGNIFVDAQRTFAIVCLGFVAMAGLPFIALVLSGTFWFYFGMCAWCSLESVAIAYGAYLRPPACLTGRSEEELDIRNNRSSSTELAFVCSDQDVFLIWMENVEYRIAVESMLFLLDVHAYKYRILGPFDGPQNSVGWRLTSLNRAILRDDQEESIGPINQGDSAEEKYLPEFQQYNRPEIYQHAKRIYDKFIKHPKFDINISDDVRTSLHDLFGPIASTDIPSRDQSSRISSRPSFGNGWSWTRLEVIEMSLIAEAASEDNRRDDGHAELSTILPDFVENTTSRVDDLSFAEVRPDAQIKFSTLKH